MEYWESLEEKAMSDILKIPEKTGRKSILVVCPVFEQRAAKLVRSFESMGYHVLVFAFGRHAHISTQTLPESIEFLDELRFTFGAQVLFDHGLLRSFTRQLRRVRRRNLSIDMVLFRDLPIFVSCSWNTASLLPGVKQVVDIADNHEFVARDIYRTYDGRRYGLWLIVLLGYRFLRTRNALAIVVCEENKKRISRRYNIDNKKIATVENVPIREKSNVEFVQCYKQRTIHEKTLVYTGLIDHRIRDFLPVLQAIQKSGWKMHFYVTNFGSKPFDILKQMVKDLLLEDVVELKPPFPFEESLSILRGYAFGVVPHRNILTVRYTIPNKIYDYAAVGLPVLTSNVRILREIVDELSIGSVYRCAEDLSIFLSKHSFNNIVQEYGRDLVDHRLNFSLQCQAAFDDLGLTAHKNRK